MPTAITKKSKPAGNERREAIAAKRRGKKLMAKHAEFEKAARKMRGANRAIEITPRGIEQIVVSSAGTHGAVLRWPTSYERGEAPSRATKDAVTDADADA